MSKIPPQGPPNLFPTDRIEMPTNVMIAHAPTGQLPLLTGIRGLAALLVLGSHMNFYFPEFALATHAPFLERGYLGVDLFFILSGYVITYVYLCELAQPTPQAAIIYVWHRFIRIYPVHLIVLLALAVAVQLLALRGLSPGHSEASWSKSDFFLNLALLQVWGFRWHGSWNAPAWSVSAELFAYLIFFGLAPLLIRIRSVVAGIVIASGILVAAMAILWTVDRDLGNSHPLVRVTVEFMCGAVLCRANAHIWKTHPLRAEVPSLLIFSIFLFASQMPLNDNVLISLLAAMIFFSGTSSGASYFLGSRFLVWLGEISYSSYMVHYPILIAFKLILDRTHLNTSSFIAPMLMIAMLIAVLGSASVMYLLIERPTRRIFRNAFGTFSDGEIIVSAQVQP